MGESGRITKCAMRYGPRSWSAACSRTMRMNKPHDEVEERKEALRARNRARAYDCSRCGHAVRIVDGAQLNPSTHFAGVMYRVCNGCGHEEAQRTRRKKGSL